MNLKDTVKSTVIRSNHVIKLIASKQNILNVKQNELSSDVKNKLAEHITQDISGCLSHTNC